MNRARDLAEAQRRAADAIAGGDPLGWFEPLYQAAERGEAVVPWADRGPNPHLLRWVTDHGLEGRSKRALVVGCGLGDDAEAVADLGFTVVAFDRAPSAVDACRRRFPGTTVDYVVADLLDPPPQWAQAFDFVFEANTVQSLPTGPVRDAAIAAFSTFVAPGGQLLVVARGRDDSDPAGGLPWPLTRAEVLRCGGGLALSSFDDFLDDEEPPVRRFMAAFG